AGSAIRTDYAKVNVIRFQYRVAREAGDAQREEQERFAVIPLGTVSCAETCRVVPLSHGGVEGHLDCGARTGIRRPLFLNRKRGFPRCEKNEHPKKQKGGGQPT